MIRSIGICLIGLVVIFFSCREKEEPLQNQTGLYFPPLVGNDWEETSPQALGWNTQHIQGLNSLLEQNGTRAFILLKDGKIVLESYFGERLVGGLSFDSNSVWYWASAGKSLTATLIGIAQDEGKLDIQNPSSDYLGKGWTSLTESQETKIRVWHQLTMTSGLDDGVGNRDDFTSDNLKFLAEPGSRWAYHNAPYTLLDKVIEGSTGAPFSQYFNNKLASKIGMTGSWQRIGFNNVYFSNSRSMARFGLLILANGKWGDQEILSKNFVQDMLTTSQPINESYGYLWWLNGKNSFMVPSIQAQFHGFFAPNAPEDMVCGIGKDGQYICVIPSQRIVLIRMGDNPDQALVPFRFIDDIWKELNNIIVQY